MNQPLEIFCCATELDQPFLEKLRIHLALKKQRGIVTLWEKSDIPPGANANEEIQKHLASAHIFLLLISPEFLADTRYYHMVLKTSLERHTHGEALTIPVIVRPTHWQEIDTLNHMQILPRNEQPISTQPDQEAALWKVAQEIETAIQRLRGSLVESNSVFGYRPSGEMSFPHTGNSSSTRVSPLEVPPLIRNWHLRDVEKSPSLSRNERNKITLIFILLAALIVGGEATIALYPKGLSNNTDVSTKRTPTSATTSPAHAYPTYFPYQGKGTFSFFDSLSQSDDHWSEDADHDTNGMCQFADGALHVKELSTGRTFSCDGPSLSNFAFEVQMTIIQGDCGGITFRDDVLIHSLYQFDICLDLHSGEYDLFNVNQGKYGNPVAEAPVNRLIAGLQHPIILGVVAQGSWIKLFVNQQQIAGYQDSSFTQGHLNLIARNDQSSQTEVVYRNATLWTF